MMTPRQILWLCLLWTFGMADHAAHPLDNWYTRYTNSSPTIAFTDVTYGNGTFVAVGNSGLIATSADGRNWTTNQPVLTPLRSVAFGAGHFAAVGIDSTII